MRVSTTDPSRFALVMTTAALGMTLLACGRQPMTYTAPTPATVKAAYECAIREMGTMDYLVKMDSATGGWVGDRDGSLHGFKYEGHVNHDVLFVTVLGNDSTSRGLRVMAFTTMWVTSGIKTIRQRTKTSDSVRADAKTVLIRCGRDIAVKATR